MKYTQNLHTHSIYGDGKDTPEEMLSNAMSLGFTSIGFSEHSPMYFSPQYEKILMNNPLYIDEIKRLKEKYKDTFEIFLGLEVDINDICDLSEYEYTIASLHYFKIQDEMIGFDTDAKTVKNIIDTYFGGDGLKFAKYYYEYFADIIEKTNEKFDIIGHFDIVAKHLDFYDFFDVESKEYKRYALEALHRISKKVDIFEINTGGIPRGYKKIPYPQKFILEEIKNLNKGVVISSDCHNKQYLNYYFDKAIEMIKAIGFKEVYKLTKDGFKAEGLL